MSSRSLTNTTDCQAVAPTTSSDPALQNSTSLRTGTNTFAARVWQQRKPFIEGDAVLQSGLSTWNGKIERLTELMDPERRFEFECLLSQLPIQSEWDLRKLESSKHSPYPPLQGVNRESEIEQRIMKWGSSAVAGSAGTASNESLDEDTVTRGRELLFSVARELRLHLQRRRLALTKKKSRSGSTSTLELVKPLE